MNGDQVITLREGIFYACLKEVDQNWSNRQQLSWLLSPARVKADLLGHFCSFLLGHKRHRLSVNGEGVDVQSIVVSSEEQQLRPFGNSGPRATITHLMLSCSVDQTRFPAQLLFSANGATVSHLRTEIPPAPQYLGIVECSYLNQIVAADREAVIEMDSKFTRIKQAAVQAMVAFGERRKDQLARGFIERARSEPFYPFRTAPDDAVASVEQAVYDVVLEKLNESTNIEGMTKRQQEVVFRLLRRSLDNQNLLEVLEEIAKLSDADMETFRQVLERTTLDCIIKLSSEVTQRLAFLDVLHKLVYGSDAKYLKERAHLHKIVEPQCWIFGPQFHLATSDKGFRQVVHQHRRRAGLLEVDEPLMETIQRLDDIPDLFLAATREYPIAPKNHHALVELKAPSVRLGGKERDQIRRYAQVIRESHEFDKQSTRWDLFLVSAKVASEIEDDRTQKNKAHGVLWEWDKMTVWALEWSEIISRAREELSLVRNHLRQKSQELTVSDYLRAHFPNILDDLNARSKRQASPDEAPSSLAPDNGQG